MRRLVLASTIVATLLGGPASGHHDPTDPENGIMLESETTTLELPCDRNLRECDPPESLVSGHSDPDCSDPSGNYYCSAEGRATWSEIHGRPADY